MNAQCEGIQLGFVILFMLDGGENGGRPAVCVCGDQFESSGRLLKPVILVAWALPR